MGGPHDNPGPWLAAGSISREGFRMHNSWSGKIHHHLNSSPGSDADHSVASLTILQESGPFQDFLRFKVWVWQGGNCYVSILTIHKFPFSFYYLCLSELPLSGPGEVNVGPPFWPETTPQGLFRATSHSSDFKEGLFQAIFNLKYLSLVHAFKEYPHPIAQHRSSEVIPRRI